MVNLIALNEAQRVAVVYNEGPALVTAGTGSGRTCVITYKLAHLVDQGWNPQRLRVLTFVNKATGEIRSRVSEMLGEDIAYRLRMGAFHSICGRILRRYAPLLDYSQDYSIYDISDTKALIRNYIKELGLNDKSHTPTRVLERISDAKNMLISPQAYAVDQEIRRYDTMNQEGELYKLYSLYTQRCRESNPMSFDGLLFLLSVFIRNFPEARQEIKSGIDFLLIGEYQDTNTSQFELARHLVADHNRIFAVSGDAQNVYSFRGARTVNILSFKQAFAGAGLFKLEQNYHSTGHIVNSTNTLIEHNQQRIPKKVYTDFGEGEKLQLYHYISSDEGATQLIDIITQRHDEEQIPLSDQTVPYRTNAQSRKFEEVLLLEGIPYVIYGDMAFYARAEVKDTMAYFQLIINPHNELALRRAIAYPRKGTGDKTIEKVALYAQQHGPQLSLYDALCAAIDNTSPAGLDRGVRSKIASFVNLIDLLASTYQHYVKLGEWIAHIFRESSIVAKLIREDTVESRAKLDDLKEFISSASEFEACYRQDPLNLFVEESLGTGLLNAFARQIPLLTNQNQDNVEQQSGVALQDRLQLMATHVARRLEFPYIYIASVEEDLLPSSRSFDTAEMIEEERRLLYIGITRVQKFCTLSYTSIRTRNGKTELMIPSRSIVELPRTHYILHEEATPIGTNVCSYASSYQPMTNSQRPTAISPNASFATVQQMPAKSSPVNALESLDGYRVGDHVRHPCHGNGEIQRIESAIGGKLTIHFDDGKTREILICYTHLDHI